MGKSSISSQIIEETEHQKTAMKIVIVLFVLAVLSIANAAPKSKMLAEFRSNENNEENGDFGVKSARFETAKKFT